MKNQKMRTFQLIIITKTFANIMKKKQYVRIINIASMSVITQNLYNYGIENDMMDI